MADNKGWGSFGGVLNKAKEKAQNGGSSIPDGEHVVKVKKLRRYFTKKGDGMIVYDVEIIRSKRDGAEVVDFAGEELEITYFLSMGDAAISERNGQRFFENTATILGRPPTEDISTDEGFEALGKATVGRGAMINKQTSTQLNSQGQPYVNIYVNKAVELAAGSAAAPAAPASTGAKIPF